MAEDIVAFLRLFAPCASDPETAARVADPGLPTDTRLWALLQTASGGVWGVCVYDVKKIGAKLLAMSN